MQMLLFCSGKEHVTAYPFPASRCCSASFQLTQCSSRSWWPSSLRQLSLWTPIASPWLYSRPR